MGVAIIIGEATPPEDLFGQKEWEGYVDARAFARDYGSNNLTIDFITSIHQKLVAGINPNISGKIRNIDVMAGDYNDPSKPVSYTKEEIDNINANDYLAFETTGDETTGFILYPFSKDGGSTEAYVSELLQQVCDWYNTEREKEGTDPHRLAALLQRKLISIHPFLDTNGTVSRLLMNWSLENSGVSPSALDNPSNDILTSEDDWTKAVQNGSKKYEDSNKRLSAMEKAGVVDIAYVLGFGPEKAFYDYVFKHLSIPPQLFTSSGMQDHKQFEEFFGNLIAELKEFQKFLQSTTTIGEQTISQGGLISLGYIKLSNSPTLSNPQTAKLLFSDINVFRGGSLGVTEVDDQMMCDLVSNFTAVGAGYRALEHADMPSMSPDKISPSHVTEAMDYYNKMVAKLYFERNHAGQNPYSQIRSLGDTIRGHTAGRDQVWDSPFASTSLSRSVSQTHSYGEKSSILRALFTAKLPSEGVVLTFQSQGSDAGIGGGLGFGSEKECLVAGAINPNSIQELRIYSGKYTSGSSEIFVIQKRQGANGVEIVINDVRGIFVIEKVYVPDGNGGYKLVSQREPKISSRSIIESLPEEASVTPTDTSIGIGFSPLDVLKKPQDFGAFGIPVQKYYINNFQLPKETHEKQNFYKIPSAFHSSELFPDNDDSFYTKKWKKKELISNNLSAIDMGIKLKGLKEKNQWQKE